VNPKLKGFDATTSKPVCFPRPEHWTIEGAGNNATAAFASWAPPSSLIPMYTTSYNESNIFDPAYNCLYEHDNWDNKKLMPALATGHTVSDDGKAWVITLRRGVEWYSGEGFTAADVRFTWDTILNRAYGSLLQAGLRTVLGGEGAYSVTGRHEITVELPQYNMLFFDWVMGCMAIMPEHAYKDTKPEGLRGHTTSTWLGTHAVKKSDGKTYAACGGVGTGP
jgi:ABC-type transport system substrate-binding protein